MATKNQEQIREVDSLAGEHETLRGRAVAAGYGTKLSDEDVVELRAELSVLSSLNLDQTKKH